MAQSMPLGLKAFLLFFLLLGVVAAGFGFWNLYHSLQCKQWPTVEGVVVSSELESHSGDADHGDTYSPQVTYQYTIAGRHFENDRLAFGAASSSSAGWAQKILERYPVGQKVMVHYAPDDPEQSVLETGIHAGTWVCFAVGAIFILVVAVFFQIVRAAAKSNAAGGTRSL